VISEYSRLTGKTFYWIGNGLIGRGGVRVPSVFNQMVAVGVMSVPTVCMATLFMGFVLAMQGAYQLNQLGAIDWVADLVGVSMLREIGPLITAVIIIGRSGSSITAELGSMKVAEEIEALEVMAIDPIRYLVVPRVLAMTIMVPCITIIGECLGLFGGWLIAVFSLHLDPYLYVTRLIEAVALRDLYSGLLKALFFGALIGSVSCYYGIKVEGGAEGVGKATTISVVTSLVAMLALDCFLTALFYFV
jgi:phospholipid/cholesterol/gamma-HCH transport system permease protein